MVDRIGLSGTSLSPVACFNTASQRSLPRGATVPPIPVRYRDTNSI
jgi:hypothetical protein